MARAYLQGQEPELEPELACPDGPHQHQHHQKQGQQYHHHYIPLPMTSTPPPSVCPVGGAPRREVAGEAEEAGGAATGAVEEDEDEPVAGPLVISSRTRSSWTCWKEEKGL